MSEQKAEISIKLDELRKVKDLGGRVLLQIKQDQIIIEIRLGVGSWNKAVENAKKFEKILVNIKGKLGRVSKNKVILEQVGIAVYEKKIK
jgi:hypothetical protein